MLPHYRLSQLFNTDNPHLLNFQLKTLQRDGLLPAEWLARYQTPLSGEGVVAFDLRDITPGLQLYCQAEEWSEFRHAVLVIWQHRQAEQLQRAMDSWKELPPDFRDAELTCRHFRC